jgi:hypothetical protein
VKGESGVQAIPQPRIDTLVIDAVSGQQRRRTDYSGTVWFGDPPQLTSFGVVARGGYTRMGSGVFVPDSLPYVASRLADAVVATTVAMQSATDDPPQILDSRAVILPDPRGGDIAWLQLQVIGLGREPLGLAYRIVVLVPLEAVAAA